MRPAFHGGPRQRFHSRGARLVHGRRLRLRRLSQQRCGSGQRWIRMLAFGIMTLALMLTLPLPLLLALSLTWFITLSLARLVALTLSWLVTLALALFVALAPLVTLSLTLSLFGRLRHGLLCAAFRRTM